MGRVMVCLGIALLIAASPAWADSSSPSLVKRSIRSASQEVNKFRNNRFNKQRTRQTVERLFSYFKEGNFDQARLIGGNLLKAQTKSGELGYSPSNKQRAKVKDLIHRIDTAEITRVTDAAENLLYGIRMVQSGQFSKDANTLVKWYGWNVAKELEQVTPKLKISKAERQRALVTSKNLTRELNRMTKAGEMYGYDTSGYANLKWQDEKTSLLYGLSMGHLEPNTQWYQATIGGQRGPVPRWSSLVMKDNSQGAPSIQQIIKNNPHWRSVKVAKFNNKILAANTAMSGGFATLGFASGVVPMGVFFSGILAASHGSVIHQNRTIIHPQIALESLERGQPLSPETMQATTKTIKENQTKLAERNNKIDQRINELKSKIGKTGAIYNGLIGSPQSQISVLQSKKNRIMQQQNSNHSQLRLISNSKLDQRGMEKRARKYISKALKLVELARQDSSKTGEYLKQARQQATLVMELVRGEIQPRPGQLAKARQILVDTL